MNRFAMVVVGALLIGMGLGGAAFGAERYTPQMLQRVYSVPVAADTLIEKGTLVVLDGGYAEPGNVDTGLVPLGRAAATVDNTDGLAGALTVTVEPGIFRWDNSAAGDAITQAHVGTQCYVVDAETVALTDGTGTRSEAGTIVAVDSRGVWVLTRWEVSLRGVDIASLDTRLDTAESDIDTAQGDILELEGVTARRQTRVLGALPAPANLHAAYDGGSGAIDDSTGPWAMKLPARQVQVVCSATCAAGTMTVTGTSEAGISQTDVLAIGNGLTTKGTKAFASITRVQTSVDPGAGETVTLQTGPGFGLGGPVTTIHTLAVDGVREATVQASAAGGLVEPTTAPNGTKVFTVQVTP